MTAAEVVAHPEYKHTIWDLPPDQKGTVAVPQGSGPPINIAYEVHGRGNRHLVVSLVAPLLTYYVLPNLLPKLGGNALRPRRPSQFVIYPQNSSSFP